MSQKSRPVIEFPEYNYEAVLEAEGITEEELPQETKAYIKDLKGLLSSKSFFLKKIDGTLTDNAKRTAKATHKEIIEGIYDYQETKENPDTTPVDKVKPVIVAESKPTPTPAKPIVEKPIEPTKKEEEEKIGFFI